MKNKSMWINNKKYYWRKSVQCESRMKRDNGVDSLIYFVLFISLLMTALYHLGLMALSTHLSMLGNLDSFWLKINLLYLMFLIKFLFALHLATINMSSHRVPHTIYKFCQLTPSWFDCSAFRAYRVLPSKSLSCWPSNVKIQAHQL